METTFFGQPSNGTNITENSFAPQNKPHTDKQSFSGILKHFRRNIKKKFTSRYEAKNYSENYFFPTRLELGKF